MKQRYVIIFCFKFGNSVSEICKIIRNVQTFFIDIRHFITAKKKKERKRKREGREREEKVIMKEILDTTGMRRFNKNLFLRDKQSMPNFIKVL